jgi:IS605 OrfB family transposase
VKLTAKVKLIADRDTVTALRETMHTANAACDWISKRAWRQKIFGQFALHRLVYKQVRFKFPLTAQVVVRCIAKVSDAYDLDKEAMREFRKDGAIAYDERILSWKLSESSVSIWTIAGRKRIPFSSGKRQSELLKNRQGETDLICNKGAFYLAATCNVDNPDPEDVNDFLGVDFGVVNIATDSDGNMHGGVGLNNIRRRHGTLRAKLQKCGSRSAKRHLRKLSGKEHRFAAHTNHCISKQIVNTAKRTSRGIAVEDLTGIRGRIRARRAQRTVLHSWAFFQLKAFLIYKAAMASVMLTEVDPRNTSRECSCCGHISKHNRPSQSQFVCRHCGFTVHADYNAALNIRSRAVVNRPIVARVASGDFQSQLQASAFRR